MRVRTTTFDDPAVGVLSAAQQAELRERYGGDLQPGKVPRAADFLLAIVMEDDDGPVACGALRVLDAATVDLKRMYVIPERRGQGLARALLAGLEDEARARGFAVARLGTGRLQPEAINLYVSAGYREIAPYGEYAEVAESRCFERPLAS